MFRKFDGKSMEGTSVKACNEAFNDLMRYQIEVIELLKFLYVGKIFHKKHGLKLKISIFYGFKPCSCPELLRVDNTNHIGWNWIIPGCD